MTTPLSLLLKRRVSETSTTSSVPSSYLVLTKSDLNTQCSRLVGWLVTLAITGLAFAIRLWGVGFPEKIIFDETYYAKDAWSVLHFGFEKTWPSGIDETLLSGGQMAMGEQASFIAHPPLGKLLIAAGEFLFGLTPLGWRFSAVVFGTGVVFMVIRLARRLSQSNLVGGIAGLLICFDGLAFVMSRIALLDIFQAFFAISAVAAVAADRDFFRVKLANYLARNELKTLAGSFGPWVWWRPWRLVAGLMFGCSIAVKWSSAYLLAAIGIWSVFSDWQARKTAGVLPNARNQFGVRSAKRFLTARWVFLRSLIHDAIPSFCYLVLGAAVVYLASWSFWLHSFPHQNPSWTPKINPHLARVFGNNFAALIDYHRQIYQFHTGNFMMHEATHSYAAHPAGWLVIGRTIGLDAVNDIAIGDQGCTAAAGSSCLRVISGMGTPVLWWLAGLALIAGLAFWLLGKDWRFGLLIVSMAAMYLPWFRYADRPVFFFYAINIIIFTVIILALILGKVLGSSSSRNRPWRAGLVTVVMVAVIANFWFIYPILTDQLLTRQAWLLRMWFHSWI